MIRSAVADFEFLCELCGFFLAYFAVKVFDVGKSKSL